MDAKLNTAIKEWTRAEYNKFTDFKKELTPLYQKLYEATKDGARHAEGPVLRASKQTERVREFLSEDATVDRCVRWQLLNLAIQNSSEGADEDVRAHVQLAKTVMASDKEGWELLIYSPTDTEVKIKASCKRSPATVKQEKAKPQERHSPHFRDVPRGEDEKNLLVSAVRNGHLCIGELLSSARELYVGRKNEANAKASHAKRTPGSFAKRVRNCSKYFYEDICKYHDQATPAFNDLLTVMPEFLLDPNKTAKSPDQKIRKFLDLIIKERYLDLAKVILQSPAHGKLLTTKQYIVSVVKDWKSGGLEALQREQRQLEKSHNDATDFDGDDDISIDSSSEDDGRDARDDEYDKTNRRELAIELLASAPAEILRSPEVLVVVMQHNLLEEKQILKSYSADGITAQSPEMSFHHVASFLGDISGILHMAVLYQQRYLVEALLRRKASLAVSPAFVYVNDAGDTIPNRKEQEHPLTPVTARHLDGLVDGLPNGEKAQSEDSGCFPLWFNNKAYEFISLQVAAVSGRVDAAAEEEKNRVLKLVQTWKSIRSALIYCTMKHAENVQKLLNILRVSKEPEREINFDMSRLLIEGTSVADFVTSMPRQGRSSSLIRYEETIRYAEFPVLDLSAQPQTNPAQNQQRSYLQHTHREILDMLNWLADHGVRRIITLRVPDRMAHPHDELKIADVVRRFRVEALDWRILDLSLNIFRPYGEAKDIPLVCTVESHKTKAENPDKLPKTNRSGRQDKVKDGRTERREANVDEKSRQKTYLRELHLYTGGRRSALDHWFGSEGLKSTNLRHVYIHVIRELTTKEQSDKTIEYINRRVEDLRRDKPSMQVDVLSQLWTAQTETPRLQEIIHHLSPRLAQFISYYRKKVTEYHGGVDKRFLPTKVAIIDNGILSLDPPSNGSRTAKSTDTDEAHDLSGGGGITSSSSNSERHRLSPEFLSSDGLWARICDGKSFVYERDRHSPWYLASNPHGTQMANLLCAIDPLCQLFVAKIADSHDGYSATRAADAVNWAIDWGVDIISMSFTTTEDYQPFNAAVQRAMNRGILVVCSHHDEGARMGTQVYPACLSSAGGNNTMLRMASCNMYGKLQNDWDDSATDDPSKKANQYDFCINSQDVAVGAIPFLSTSTERISGSSVATAIAAGVCSLLIACLRTLRDIDFDSSLIPEDKARQMHEKVKRALQPQKRPMYSDVVKFLKSMGLSTANPRFISLDRFAHLDELRDINTNTLTQSFYELGNKFRTD